MLPPAELPIDPVDSCESCRHPYNYGNRKRSTLPCHHSLCLICVHVASRNGLICCSICQQITVEQLISPLKQSSLQKEAISIGQYSGTDFTKKWDLSDVALKTPNSEKLVYVNKNLLAIFSPFFKALFFSDFLESKKEIIDIGIEFEVMLEIARILHHSPRAGYSGKMLEKLYETADMCGIEKIMSFCREEFHKLPAREAINYFVRFELSEEKIEFLAKMQSDEMRSLLAERTHTLLFSPIDVAIILEKTMAELNPNIAVGVTRPATPWQMLTSLKKSGLL